VDASLSALTPDPSAWAGERRKKPGPKPGSRHDGMFKPGFDERRSMGNNSPLIKKQFHEAIADEIEPAIQLLRECIADPKAPYKERRAAAELVLAHAVGTPVNRVVHAQVGDSVGGSATSMSLEELRKKAAFLLSDDLETTYEELSDD